MSSLELSSGSGAAGGESFTRKALQLGLYGDAVADIRERSAKRSRTSLCRQIVTLPVGHDRACSTVKVLPHTQSLGRVVWCPVVSEA